LNLKKKIKEERKEEKKRIFRSDLHIYNCLINEINENDRDEDDIPDIFKNKFIILKKLHDDNEYSTLNDDIQYEKYVQITKEMNLSNQFIKTKYDDLFDNVIYNNSEDNDTENEIESDNETENETEDE
jgi:hypothetical protein